MKRYIIAFGLIFALQLLFWGDKSEETSSNDKANVIVYEVYNEFYSYSKNPDIHFYIPRVDGLDDVELQDKINQSLKNASVEWINESCLWLTDSEPEVIFQSEKYLTVERKIILSETPRFWYVTFYVTINIETGQRVRLKDFISVNEEYAQKLKNEYVTYGDYPLFQDWEVAELLEMLKTADMTEAEYLASFEGSGGSTVSLLSCKPAYGFMGDRIELKYSTSWGNFVVINPDDGSFITNQAYAGG